jgi:peptide/nickel transport system permease protein
VILLIIIYILAIFAEFFSPYTVDTRFEGFQQSPPSKVHWIRPDGSLGRICLHINRELDPNTFGFIYRRHQPVVPDQVLVARSVLINSGTCSTPIGTYSAWIRPSPYSVWRGSIGRDVFSRTIHGARISLSIGLVGVFLSFILGIILGGISGYFGGLIDDIIQRIIDFLLAIPGLPLWMTLAAALPRDMPTLSYILRSQCMLSILGWTGLARVVRGKLLQLREEDYALAARGAGASDWRIITRHLLARLHQPPDRVDHLQCAGHDPERNCAQLHRPRHPAASGQLGHAAAGCPEPDCRGAADLADDPGLWVITTVLLFNFVGDGLRDAADPYTR